MKVAVLGADDCLGTRLIESCELTGGATVAAIGRHPGQLTRAARFSVDLKVADVLDVDSLARSFAGCSAAVHTLAVDPTELKRSALVFCRAAAQAGVRRAIYLSSADVHGFNPAPDTTEKSPLQLRHTHERLNLLVAAERQFESEARSLGLPYIILRPGLIYGPRAPLVGNIATEFLHDRAWLFDKGAGICNCVGVDNLVSAVRQALKAKSVGATFLITDEETVTWRGLYQAIAHDLEFPLRAIRFLAEPGTLSNPPLSPERGLAGLPALPNPLPLSETMIARQQCTWKFPGDHARKELGLPLPVSFTEGLRRALAWWRYAQGEFSSAA